MAGFSIILLMLLFSPLILLASLALLLGYAALEFVQSPAFPLMLLAILFSVLAFVDVARIVWRRYKEHDAFPLTWSLLVRPAILVAISFALFVAMCVVAGSMVLAWYQSLG